jgi:hypothetical protein
MPRQRLPSCPCGCGVTSKNCRKIFRDTYPYGYPFEDGYYYCCYDDKDCPNQGGNVWHGGMQVDHVISRRQGGADCISNLQVLCATCNMYIKNKKSEWDKEGMTADELREYNSGIVNGKIGSDDDDD